MSQTTTSQGLDRRTFWIGVSAIIFAVLLAAHAIRPTAFTAPANAATVADSRDYQLVTSAQPDGNEALYVLDRRNGLVAMVKWNISQGRPEVVDVKPVGAAFLR